jgi:uncharacterized membrane protein YbhN (UPF0104 family)
MTLRRLLVVAGAAGGIALFVVFARSIDLRATARVLGHADLALVGLAVVANALATALRGWRWQLLLEPVLPLARLVRYTFAAHAANNVLPARAGEAMLAWEVSRREQIPLATVGASVVLTHVLDAVSLLPFVLPLPFLLALPPWVKQLVAIVVTLALAGTLAAAWAARRSGRIGETVRALRSRRRAAASLFASVLAWALEIAVALAAARAVGISLPPAAGCVLLMVVNLAIALPSAPASVGAHEAGSIAALAVLGVQGPEALSFALVFHAVQIVSVMLPGLPILLSIISERSRVQMNREQQVTDRYAV